ncbi:MAG: tyrosine--tRNA ligase, partial [Tissierellia bacterium]|nr:tyrosine--tRNA ligase [Tissierellia bacterium]
MKHMQNHGHVPIALLGGGTTMIGDPSDRTDMRKLMTKEIIDNNALCFKKQISKFLDFTDNKAIFDNNADWLLDLNFLDFMRDIGVHFSVNRMLTFDCYKNRLEQGLTFFEFGYMLMQSYDFLVLNNKHNCKLQMGGSDQWSNILGGIELCRKKNDVQTYGMTFKLLTTAAGIKMGKTAKGAIWLDKNKTTPFEMFQYLRNCDDRDVAKFLKLLTFLPLEEIEKLTNVEGQALNKAKEVLAYEVVKFVHSKKDADEALSASKSLFGGSQDSDDIPFLEMSKDKFENGFNIVELMNEIGAIKSNSEGRRLISQGGVRINDEKVDSHELNVNLDDFEDDKLMIRKGKKYYFQIRLK